MNRTTSFLALTLILLAASATGYAQSASIDAIEWNTYWNSGSPSGQNDGWVWQGKGFTSEAGLSFRASVPFIKLNVRPSVLTTQNKPFTQSGRTKQGIDLPDRIYSASETQFALVNSSLFLEALNVAAGISNENRWWGPGVRNSIMLSNHAPGFDHVRVQTVKPQNIGVGTFHVEYIIGRLEGSRINPESYPQGWRLFTGIQAALSPSFLPSLRVGLHRTFIANQQDLKRTSDYFPLFQSFQKVNLRTGIDRIGNAPDDQRASVFFTWNFSETGFRVYGEFAREDHNVDIRDAFLQPNHIRAYQIGIEKMSESSRTNVEFTQMQVTLVNPQRGQAPWYTHTVVRRGYTHEGQVLGSGVGPGGSSLFFQHERNHTRGKTALFLERAEREVEFANQTYGVGSPKEVDYLVGLRHTHEIGQFTVSPEVELMHTQNRFNVLGHTQGNVAIRLRVGYRL